MRLTSLFLLLFILMVSPLSAQIENQLPGGFRFKSLLTDFDKPSITTSFNDVDTSAYGLFPNFGDSVIAKNILDMPRNIKGAFMLCPGFYQMVCKSYCIKAGTYGPSKGDCYLYAPLNGPKANLMKTLLANAEKKGNIQQRDLQLLFWAIIAKTKFKDLDAHLQFVAMSLLSASQLVEFNGGALGFVPDILIDKALLGMPKPVQEVLRAENQMRRMFKQANRNYEEFERLAVLSGSAPETKTFKRGRWNFHPAGYFIRYFPTSYHKTAVQVFVPSKANLEAKNFSNLANTSNDENCLYQVEFNAIGSVATPANTGAQRLLQSNENY